MERRDVDVQLAYWTSPLSAVDVTVSVKDLRGTGIADMSGKSCWHPATHWPVGGPVAPDPHYVIITVKDVVDVAEHARGTVRMSTDEVILAAARASIARGECRASPDNY